MINSLSYATFVKEAGAMNILSKISPFASKAYTGAKALMKNEYRNMSGFDKAMTFAPAALALPGMFNKKDQEGRSRAQRISGIAGNVGGGLLGGALGSRASSAITNKMPGRIGKGLGFAASTIGLMGGSIVGEKVTEAPFKMLKPNKQPQYALQQQSVPPQSQFPMEAQPKATQL